MIQTVRAKDTHSSQLFRWDKENRIITLPHDDKVWYCGLNESDDFICLKSEPKQKNPKGAAKELKLNT